MATTTTMMTPTTTTAIADNADRRLTELTARLEGLITENEKLKQEKEKSEFDTLNIEAVQKLNEKIARLEEQNELFRKALLEIEAEKATMAYNQLGSSLKIRMLLQEQSESV